jgi:DNA invertase Pin-like site-specific DNA recombinase
VTKKDSVLVGYMRGSKADGSQTVERQRYALLAAGIDAKHLYDDYAFGRRDDRPGLASCLKALRDRGHACRVEAGQARAEPAPPRNDRS